MVWRVVSSPPKLNRVSNVVSSVLTSENRLTISQNDAKIKVKMAIKRVSRSWVVSVAGLVLITAISCLVAFPQKIVDKTVATVTDGFQTELITLSDLRWQLALQPGTSLTPTRSEDLNAALRRLIDQRIFALEAKRLPRNPPSEKEVADEIKFIVSRFPTAGEFEARLREVGFSSVNDENFQRIIADRLSIEKYLAFRFRSFIVVTAKDEETYYREVFAPDFRARYPGLLMPTLEEKRADIHSILIEQRVEADIQAFLDNAKQRVSVVIINPV
jgi:hypothetical protein